MASILATLATYDGTTLVQFGTGDYTGQVRLALQVVRGLDEPADVRGADTVIPAGTGRVARNRVADRRTIELAGFVAGTGGDEAAQRADFRAAVEQLRALFDPTRAPATLSVLLEDGASTATILARPVNMAYSDGPLPSYREVSIELESVVPDWTIDLLS